MSVYDHRDKPAYRGLGVKPHYCRNPHILKWWTSAHDLLIPEQIAQYQWDWSWEITAAILAITPSHVIDVWRKEDPLCSQYAWYNILMNFAVARAESLGLTERIRKPEWKICPLCNQRFVEDSLPFPLVQRLGIDNLDFCAPCLRDTVLQGSGTDSLSKEQVLGYLRELSDVLQRVPSQSFGEGVEDFHDLGFQERLAILCVLRRKPSIRHVKGLFGSWLAALIEAGVLEDGTRRTGRGIQSLAKDGHVCLSLGEKTIDDFLYAHDIPHEREPRYPEGLYRGDFLVDGVFIEYFGLKGDPDYDAKTRLKQRICRKHGIKLISIYPSDLVSRKKLERKLLGGLQESR